MKITSFGTTTLLFDDGKGQVLFDANFTRSSMIDYLFKNVYSDRKLIDEIFDRHKIKKLRAIFISHTHYDHVIDDPYIAKKTGAKIYGSLSTKNVALAKGINPDQVEVFKGHKKYNIND
ncbi:MAG: MBL fold metallo-hydrolase [Finegoldia sp.]|nr:MBL fold metallo-hydrolase [Finegoldia sp.]